MRFIPLKVKKDSDEGEPELWVVWDIRNGCRRGGFVKHKYEAEQLAKQFNEKEKRNEKIHG